jgi:nucleoside-diphosphate-sugar epimerase
MRMIVSPPFDEGPRKRVLVTGGGGFIGSHLVRRCMAGGHEVHVLLRPTSDGARLADLASSVRVHRAILSDSRAVRACLDEARPTHIFHLANGVGGRHDGGVAGAAQSVDDLSDFLRFMADIATLDVPPAIVVRTGSVAEYGGTTSACHEDQREHPGSAYAAALVAGTHYADMVARTAGFPIVTARLSLVYGPGQAHDFLVPGLLAACLTGQPFVIQRPLDQRDIVHVIDVVDALCRLAVAPVAGAEIFNIGSGEAIEMGQLADRIAVLAGVDPMRIVHRPQGDPTILRPGIERIRMRTGWAPRIRLDDGLAELVEEARRAGTAVAA